MFTYVCKYVCMYVCVYVHIRMYIYTCVIGGVWKHQCATAVVEICLPKQPSTRVQPAKSARPPCPRHPHRQNTFSTKNTAKSGSHPHQPHLKQHTAAASDILNTPKRIIVIGKAYAWLLRNSGLKGLLVHVHLAGSMTGAQWTPATWCPTIPLGLFVQGVSKTERGAQQ